MRPSLPAACVHSASKPIDASHVGIRKSLCCGDTSRSFVLELYPAGFLPNCSELDSSEMKLLGYTFVSLSAIPNMPGLQLGRQRQHAVRPPLRQGAPGRGRGPDQK